MWAGLAGNPALPAAVLEWLVGLEDPDLGLELAERTDLTEQQVEALAERGIAEAGQLVAAGRIPAERVDPRRRPFAALALLRAGRAPEPDEWARLLLERPDLWRELASTERLPAAAARHLLAAADQDVLIELAEAQPDPGVLVALAAHSSWHVRRAVGWNPAAPPDVLADLLNNRPALESCEVCERHPVPWTHPPDCPDPACDLPAGAACDGSHQYARHAIVEGALAHPAAPAADALRQLDAPSAFLRARLAERTDLDPDAYAQLADEKQLFVLTALAENPAIGEPLIRRLATIAHESVRRAVVLNPAVPLDLLDRARDGVVLKLGTALPPRIAAADPDETERLAASPDPEIRRLLALRRDLPPHVRDRLADDPAARVANAIAPHPGLDTRQLTSMHRRHGRHVGPGIATNPNAPATLLRALTTGDHNVATLRALARHPAADGPTLTACLRDRRAREQAATHPALPLDHLRTLLADPATTHHAAANPSLPPADLLRLLPPGALPD
ncbi:hypothetical protein KSE_14990 [Kitasatospora setae KM-6054]|uniref:Leucine rich repeat variant n=1 Tax=Kitasatospora setae (strain ATCC 33774 / DSM 43861 / JCM 3304 / KCC A-0304 / NBRC 14216 / KM-6054) TaxID=452652 RepID=E4N7Z5_KITSK|nr:hypothetical protein KSE_14990 [Kitasatospora setae KM-6054]